MANFSELVICILEYAFLWNWYLVTRLSGQGLEINLPCDIAELSF